jgi:hypothetical protein
MATQAQIDANRRNSQKSTGPRTDAGKTASSQNATRSGIYANSLLVDGEDPSELEALIHEYLDTCRPAGPRERAAVDSLIHTDWLLRRMRRVETEQWNSQSHHLRKVKGDEFDEEHILLNTYRYIEDRIDRIQRRLTTLERLYHRRLAELERLQARRPASPDPEPPPALSPDPAPTTHPEIGFVPSNSPAAVTDPTRHAPAPMGFVSSKSIPNPLPTPRDGPRSTTVLTDRRLERI